MPQPQRRLNKTGIVSSLHTIIFFDIAYDVIDSAMVQLIYLVKRETK